jgi:hypothetical protein
MSKASKRPGRASRDVHERIKAEADSMRKDGPIEFTSAERFPELARLVESSRQQIGKAVPRTIVHEGRAYYVRVSLAAYVEVFPDPACALPMVRATVMNSEEFGHAPGH